MKSSKDAEFGITVLSRIDFEDRYIADGPYLLITIRKPGTRFVSLADQPNCAAQLRLMFHEHDGERFNSQGVVVEFCERQAKRIVEFVRDNRFKAKVLVLQSEFASQEVVAIGIAIGRWLNTPVSWSISYVDPSNVAIAMVTRAAEELFKEHHEQGETV